MIRPRLVPFTEEVDDPLLHVQGQMLWHKTESPASFQGGPLLPPLGVSPQEVQRKLEQGLHNEYPVLNEIETKPV